MQAAVIVFPGSNCDRDVAVALEQSMGKPPVMVWHKENELPKADLIVLPGGFSYGDYLRCGAIAAHSNIMPAVRDAAAKGTAVLGICNGFQVLIEAGLLPGALLRNRSLKYLCKDVTLKVESSESPFTAGYKGGQTITVPIAHGDGNYFLDPEGVARLEDQGRVAFRYCDAGGAVTDASNPNGSVANIAGIFNEKRNVLGMMPHPERLSDPALGGSDGRAMFDGLVGALS